MAVRSGWSTSPAPRRGPLAWAVMLLTSLAVVGLGAGLCLPGTPLSAMFLFCTLLLAEESWAWASHVRRCVEVEPGTGQAPKRGQNYFSSPKNLARHPVSRENSSDPFFAPEEVTQQLTRSQAANGAEQLAGWLRLPFAAGQRTGNLHVAFCPPFASTPELTVEQIDGPEARIKTAQVLPYGARLDLKLAAAAEEPTAIVLQFSARTP